jgi:four helix bundle protein
MGKSYRDLIVWVKAIALVTEVYQISRTFPKHEMFGLQSQLQRTAVSIPSNIAEGWGRLSKGEFRLFLGHARGSLAELETQIIIAQNLNYLKNEDADKLQKMTEEVHRLINGLISSLKTDKPNPHKKTKD